MDLPTVCTGEGEAWSQVDNPARDGWESEVVGQHVDVILKKLGQLLLTPDSIDSKHLRPFVADGFDCDALVPTPLHTVFKDKALVIQRPEPGQHGTAAGTRDGTYHGPEGLADAMHAIAEPFRGAVDVRFKFKLFRLQPIAESHGVTTRQYFAISGRTADGFLERNATWVMNWTLTDGDEAPKLLGIETLDFEQVSTRTDNLPLFADCTESVLAQNDCFRQQLLYGMNHWLQRSQDTRYFSTLGNPGLAVGDVNGDGLEDLFLCQEGGLPNRLFLQRPDGTAIDVSREWAVDWLENSRAALLLDLDNDGDQDLVVSIIGGLVVAANENQNRFEVRAVLPTDDDTMTLTAADYDLDGDVDLYVCVDYPNDYFAESRDISVAGGASNRVYHDANNAGRNSLFRNDIATRGEWVFTDVTEAVGLDVNNRRFSLAACWEDFDNDGDQDLYVANDFGRNNLYQNLRADRGVARFIDVAKDGQAEDSASGMSVAWGDVNRDGLADVYVANMFSAAGGRITGQHDFKPDDPIAKARLRRFARGSTLLKNLGHGVFQDVSVDARVTVGRWAWSSNFVDLNNDGWEDIVVANGYITGGDAGDL